MNWMTSGKHRALYSQRGRRRQMHFPSQVQRQRVKPTSPPRHSQREMARDSTTPWYIVSVGDDDESQDIRVLEQERKGAMVSAEADKEAKTEEDEPPAAGGDGRVRSSPTQKRSRQQQAKDERSESRCIFTPVKKARKIDYQPGAAQFVKWPPTERPPSSIASGIDMLFFNDGEELPHKNKVGKSTRVSSLQASSDDNGSRFLQRTSENEDHSAPQVPPPPRFNQSDGAQTKHVDAQQFSPDDESFKSFQNTTGDRDLRDRHLWRGNVNSQGSSSPGMTFSRPDTPRFRNGDDIIPNSSHAPPSSTCTASPLSFRMSRAEVLQSQLSSKIIGMVRSVHNHAAEGTTSLKPVAGAQDPAAQLHNFGSLHASPSSSPSTSTSSQGSIELARPPLGWQNKMMLSLKEGRIDRLDQRISTPPQSLSPVSPASTFGSAPVRNHDSLLRNHVPISSLSRSSTGSDGENSSVDSLIPIDAKERIMAAANCQQHPEDMREWLQRPVITKLNSNNITSSIHEKTMSVKQQSWVVSSRTKTILNAVSASKVSTSQSLIEKRDSQYQEMESVAIYMYTLVQCYKIDENLRADGPNYLVPEHAHLKQGASNLAADIAISDPAPRRHEIVFSPKCN